MMIFFWILIVLGFYYIIQNKGDGMKKANQYPTAQELLKERFVKGEIDEITFERMNKTIKY